MEESLSGIVERITYHNPENGWTIFKVKRYGIPDLATVIAHQAQIFAGATMEFRGNWATHHQYGRQFKAVTALEQKPASIGALEKYIGSGMIHGIGPAIAKRIVKHFGKDTLEVFEHETERLEEVSGISKRKLEKIKITWEEHRAIRDVMIFLQSHNISTLFAVKIYKEYGNESIETVSKNPYRLARDIYGIGFLSADKVALSVGFDKDSTERIAAGVLHVLAAAREEGHCYLTANQVCSETNQLLQADYTDQVINELLKLEHEKELKTRRFATEDGETEVCYYNKSLWYDEDYVADKVKMLDRVERTYEASQLDAKVTKIEDGAEFPLSPEQREAVIGIVNRGFSVLTGGPGCGKTTTLRVFVKLLEELGKKIILAAPTGRAAQRMGEVIGKEAKTIHRLLIFNPTNGQFKHNQENPLKGDVLIVDECSMLDISLTASLLKAVPIGTQVLFIGDVDQLPSVGAGNVLADLINSRTVGIFRLNTVFRQAQESSIIQFAHQINTGKFPEVETPFRDPALWKSGNDCLFIDAEEATSEQLRFIKRCKSVLQYALEFQKKTIAVEHSKKGKDRYLELSTEHGDASNIRISEVAEEQANYYQQSEEAALLTIPEKFRHVDPQQLAQSPTQVAELSAVLKRVHPFSAMHYGHTASQMVMKLFKDIIPKYLGGDTEIQVLSPMTRGSLGTNALNTALQAYLNPPSEHKPELKLGERVFRKGDRVIQRRNNYDLEVFNGDIGNISNVNPTSQTLQVTFGKVGDRRIVMYAQANISELDLAYAITIHKSQGSEFDAVILPIAPQHYNMLYRNLIYTGLTRGKKMVCFVGSRFALHKAVNNEDNRKRQTYLEQLLKS